MENEQMGFLSKIKNSIINPKAYVQFLKESGGRAVLYLFLITLILGCIGRIRTVYDFNNILNKAKDSLNKEVRDFTFEDGKLTVEGEMPIIIKEADGSVFIIDTSGKTNESILDKYEKAIFITDTKMVNKENSLQKRVTDFSSIKFSLNKEKASKFIHKAKLLNSFIILFGTLWFFLKQFIFALFTTLLALIVNAFVKARVNFGEVYKLTLYALTVPIILNTVLDASGINGISIWATWGIYWVVALIYLGLGFKAIRDSEQEKLDLA